MRVMVGIDDSDESFYALQWSLDHIFSKILPPPPPSPSSPPFPDVTVVDQAPDDHLLILVHVHQPFQPFGFPAPTPGLAAIYPSRKVMESVRKAEEQIAAALLSRALQMCKDKMIKAESVILEGDTKYMLCESSEQMNVDLLIVGSRGLGKIKRAFIGSVSDYCAHHANCPTLIVKPPKETSKLPKK